MTTARLIKVPKRWMIVIDDKIVDMTSSKFSAASIAENHGAKKLEIIECKNGTTISSFISRSQGSSGSSRKAVEK